VQYTIEVGSGAMIYMPSFMKIAVGIQKLGGGETHTDRQHGDLISLLLLCFQNKERRPRE
jgi:hypothetical protein